MRARIILLLFLALPLAAQRAEDQQRQIDSIKAEFKARGDSLVRRIDRLEDRWSDIKEEATEARKQADRIVTVVLCIGGLLLTAFFVYGFISVYRMERDLRYTKESRQDVEKIKRETETLAQKAHEDADRICEFRDKSEKDSKFIETKAMEIQKMPEAPIAKRGKKGYEGLRRGYVFLQNKQYDQALEAFNKVIEKTPRNATAWFYKGYCLVELTQYEQGIIAYDEAIKLKPQIVTGYYNKGIALSALDRYEEALKSFDEVIRLTPDLAEAHYSKGLTLGNLDRYEEALKSFDEAIRLKPNHAEAHFNRACTLSKLGKLNKVLESLAIAKEIEGKKFNFATEAWLVPELAPLRQGKWRKRFEKIVGPLLEKK